MVCVRKGFKSVNSFCTRALNIFNLHLMIKEMPWEGTENIPLPACTSPEETGLERPYKHSISKCQALVFTLEIFGLCTRIPLGHLMRSARYSFWEVLLGILK